jgi:chromosome condensin MukBEF ATPase and DNA-binding subunit MukB
MSTKKSNIDWLRQIIEKSEKSMDADEYKEAIEFLDAIQEDVDDLNKEIENKDDEIKSLESDIDDKQGEINNLENQEPSWTTIHAGIGIIEWQSDNIQLQHVMEALQEKLKTTSPNKITAILES